MKHTITTAGEIAMTLEQKIADLDKKFEGFAVAYNGLDKDDDNSNFCIVLKNDGGWVIQAYIKFTYTGIANIQISHNKKTMSINLLLIEDCIDKMHDYFILKGGNL